jgi:hypothetical protein
MLLDLFFLFWNAVTEPIAVRELRTGRVGMRLAGDAGARRVGATGKREVKEPL